MSMWSSQPDEMLRRRAEPEGTEAPLHNTLPPPDDHGQEVNSSDTATGDPSSRGSREGTWGERDAGPGVNREEAMQDFEVLRDELHRLSLHRSQSRASGGKDGHALGLSKSPTGHSLRNRDMTRTKTTDTEFSADGTAADPDSDSNDFELDGFLKEGHFEKRTEAGDSAKKVGVTFKNLTVKGVGAKAMFAKTLPDAVMGTFGPDLYHLLCRFIPALTFGRSPPMRELIHDFTGLVKHGEMMLVLGRPGSGCSTFLKSIANQRTSFAQVTGDVSYGGISAEEQLKSYKGEVSYNPEADQHFPTLNVWQTLQFSLMNKTRKHFKDEIPVVIDALLKMFGISHTAKTLVGNEYTPGVSGGERKRVGIAETLATKSSVTCWDNSTRGLDASTALDYTRSLRIMTDVSDRTTLVTLYQAGEDIYSLMDKVLVIEQGRMIYQGPANEAKAYFQSLGFYHPPAQTTPDFLTSIGDANERKYQTGREAEAPKTAEDLEEAFRSSTYYKKLLAEINDYETDLQQSGLADTRQFQEAVGETKSKHVSKQSSYTVSFLAQVWACTLREFWLLWGDMETLKTKFFIIITNGLIVGSLFYGESLDSSGAFPRGGALFFAILFLGWLQLSELMKAVSGRVVVARHRDYAFYRPSAVAIARVFLDFPLILLQVVFFSIVIYFMTNLDVDVSKFFIFMLFIYTTTITITALYRMFAALSPTIDDAVRFSGIALNLLIIYTGYVIPYPQLINKYIWFGWIYYTSPVSYSFEAVMANEFAGRQMECAPSQRVPNIPGADPRYQGCATTGYGLGETSIDGAQYLDANFKYTRHHLWRNWGVIIAFGVLYILVTAVASEVFTFIGGGGGALLYRKTKNAKKMMKQVSPSSDEEKGAPLNTTTSTINPNSKEKETEMAQIARSESVFTWSDVEFSVPVPGGTRKLLDKVTGYAKPGIMIALMGASGAGKTTLLNTLSQRQPPAAVTGEMLLDGRPLGAGFQRGTGFVEQMDLHDGSATIREALDFAAMLRQDRHIPKAEKLAYVDKIVDLLELTDIQDALILSLDIEQKKRLTIGVELAAQPETLLFLDEPTSGLDSQSAYSIVRFLKKLTQAGQAIVCTIHQPSSVLIQEFDMILALNPGGRTFYFGPVGENGAAVRKYFADRGTTCPPEKNVAEFILETAAKGGRRGPDGKRLNWNNEWRKSEQNATIVREIERLKTERSKAPEPKATTQDAFAAPVWLQSYLLTKRMFLQHWREPSYIYGKLFTSVIVGIFNGFTFWQLDNSVVSLQLRMFTCFLALLIAPTFLNAVLPKFYMNRALWEFREHPSRTYGWVAFCTAQVISEIPAAVVGSVLYWLFWYYAAGLPTDSSTAGYVFLMTMLFFTFQASWGQWITAFAPSFTVISNVLPFFLVMFALFNGVVRPYSQLSVFWRYWIYYLNPATYFISGLLAATMRDLKVVCAPSELTRFNPPPGQTCAEYAGAFVREAGKGYLSNQTATSNCGYCPYATGPEFLATLNIKPSEKWRDFGIFLAFCISNWALVYFLIYTVRVRGWSFGFGYLYSFIPKTINAVSGLFSKRKEKTETSVGT